MADILVVHIGAPQPAPFSQQSISPTGAGGSTGCFGQPAGSISFGTGGGGGGAFAIGTNNSQSTTGNRVRRRIRRQNR